MQAIEANLARLGGRGSKKKRKADKRSEKAEIPTRDAIHFDRVLLRLKSELSLLGKDWDDKHEAVRVFVDDIARLNEIGGQWEQFVTQICTAKIQIVNLDVLPAEKQNSLASEIRSIANRVKNLPAATSETLTDKLVAKDPETVVAELKFQLEKMTLRITRTVFSFLNDLVEAKILGTISWADQENCHFVDWDHIISATYDGTRETYESAIVSRQNEGMLDEVTVWEHKTIRRKTGSMSHVAIRREQHLMRAYRSTLSDPNNTIPRRFNSLIAAIPTFLRNDIEVVSGECFKNVRTPSVLQSSKWEQQSVEVRRKVYLDPAATLGSVVLFSWDDQDEHKERLEKNLDQQLSPAIESISISIGLLIILSIVFTQNVGSAIKLGIVFCGLASSGYFFNSALTSAAGFKRRNVDGKIRLTTVLGWFVFSAGILLLASGIVEQQNIRTFLALPLIVGGGFVVKATFSKLKLQLKDLWEETYV